MYLCLEILKYPNGRRKIEKSIEVNVSADGKVSCVYCNKHWFQCWLHEACNYTCIDDIVELIRKTDHHMILYMSDDTFEDIIDSAHTAIDGKGIPYLTSSEPIKEELIKRIHTRMLLIPNDTK